MTLIAPSILAADFRNLEREFVRIQKSDAKWIHCDVMDGIFVPNISFGFPIISSIRKLTNRFIDVHFMVTEPHRYITLSVESGADGISFHIESASPIRETIDTIHAHGKKAGLAVSPDTPVERITPYANEIDYLLIMSVYPGFWGQSFLESTYEKILWAKKIHEEHGAHFLIEIDGGVSIENSHTLHDSGADILVSGSALFRADDFARYVQLLQK